MIARFALILGVNVWGVEDGIYIPYVMHNVEIRALQTGP